MNRLTKFLKGNADEVTSVDVYVNDIHVGTLSAKDYFDIRSQVYRDPMVYLKMFAGLARFIFDYMTSFLVGFPAAVLWFMFLSAYFSPETFTNMTTIIQNPDALKQAVAHYWEIILVTWFVGWIVQAVLFMDLSKTSSPDGDAIAKLIRIKLNVSTKGWMEIYGDADEKRASFMTN